MRSKTFALTLTALILVLISANFFAAAQNQSSTQTLLALTQQTKNQLETLINQTYANQTTIQTAENYGLTKALEGNITLYRQGTKNLTLAETQISNGNYDAAQTSLIQALTNFKISYKSLNSILSICNPQPKNLDAQTVIEANNRAQERITWLKTVVPKNATGTLSLLDEASNCFKFTSYNQLATEEQITAAVASMQQGNGLINQVYQQLKLQSETLDSWRLGNYCNSLIAQVQERFQYGSSQGVNITAFLQSMGYHNESDYITNLQQQIQEINNQPGDFQSKLSGINSLSCLIQSTDQALNQEIIRHGGSPNGGSDGSGGSSNNPSPTPSGSGGSNSTGGPSSGAGSYKGKVP
jgi:hypothetical protein